MPAIQTQGYHLQPHRCHHKHRTFRNSDRLQRILREVILDPEVWTSYIIWKPSLPSLFWIFISQEGGQFYKPLWAPSFLHYVWPAKVSGDARKPDVDEDNLSDAGWDHSMHRGSPTLQTLIYPDIEVIITFCAQYEPQQGILWHQEKGKWCHPGQSIHAVFCCVICTNKMRAEAWLVVRGNTDPLYL